MRRIGIAICITIIYPFVWVFDVISSIGGLSYRELREDSNETMLDVWKRTGNK